MIAAGGTGARFGGDRPKQFLPLAGTTLLRRSLLAAAAAPEIGEIVVSASAPLQDLARREATGIGKVRAVVEGGETRTRSVANALAVLSPGLEVVVVHDAARPLASASLFSATIGAARAHGAAVAALPVDDTLKRVGDDRSVRETVSRDGLWRVQTPQAFRADLLRRAHEAAGVRGEEATDDAALVERIGGTVTVVAGEPANLKITGPEDLALAERWVAGADPARTVRLAGGASVPVSRVGFGRDKHPLVAGRPFVLAGVTFPSEVGPLGHSDGDALCHAIADAVVGAAAAGDLGRLFPDDAEETLGITGLAILAGARAEAERAGFVVASVDATVWLRAPKLGSALDAMRAAVADALRLPVGAVSIKAKSGNGLDAVGRGEAVEGEAVAVLTAI